MRMLSLFIAVASNGLDVPRAGVLELLRAHSLAQHRVPALDVLRAVCAVDAGPELEMPLLRGRVNPVQLLHLRVRDLEHHGDSAVTRRGGAELLRGVDPRGGAEHLDVAQDDPREEDAAAPRGAAGLEGGDDIDLVADLERPGE